MDSNTDKIPDKIIELVENKIGSYPCLIQTPFYSSEVLKSIMKNSKEIWFNHFIDGVSVYRVEGLFDYGNSGIYVYYNGKEDNKYRFVFLSDESKKDSIGLTIKQFNNYKINEIWS